MQGRLVSWALCVLGTAVIGAGCSKTHAQTVPDSPPLAMPQPPSRVFAPIEEEPLAASPTSPEPPSTQPAPRVPNTTRPAPRQATRPPETEKVEPVPAAAATPPAVEPPRELRAASAPADAEAERRIGEVLSRARSDLNRVDYRNLTRGGKEQYDQAKGFSDEAEKALKERNFVYAQTAADKAAKMASELLGR